MKRFLSVLLVLSLCLTPSTLAASPIYQTGVSIQEGNQYKNDEPYLTDYLLIEDGVARRITASELEEVLGSYVSTAETNVEMQSSDPEPRRWDDIYEYKDVEEIETRPYKEFSEPVSAWQETGPEGGSFTVAEAKTFGRTYSLSIGAPEIRAVTSAIGAAWTVTNTTTVSSTINTKPNAMARLRYAPECTRYDGTLVHRKWNYELVSSSSLTVYQPTDKLNGLFYVEYK